MQTKNEALMMWAELVEYGLTDECFEEWYERKLDYEWEENQWKFSYANNAENP